MKVLVVSNFYPPRVVGGYEIGCQQVVDGLRDRGHDVQVLTSGGPGEDPGDSPIHRRLVLDDHGRLPALWRLCQVLYKEQRNRRAVHGVCLAFRPDVVLVYNLRGAGLSLLGALARWAEVVVCAADYWFAEWMTDPWFRVCRVLAHLPGVPAPQLGWTGHVHFPSRFLQQRTLGVLPSGVHAEVVYWGIDVDLFAYRVTRRAPARLLSVGQVVEHKGVHTVIEAMGILRQTMTGRVTLTIVGGSLQPDYVADLDARVQELGLGDAVDFVGPVEREALPAIYHDHDIMVIPSVWDEPLGLTCLEAMASGLAVVSSGAGGNAEIFTDGVNGLLFAREQAQDCARQIQRFTDEPRLYEEIRAAGRKTVEQRFTIDQMVDGNERVLLEAIGQERPT